MFELAVNAFLVGAGLTVLVGTVSVVTFALGALYMKWCEKTRDGFSDVSIRLSPLAWQNAIRRWPVWCWTLHRYFRFSLDDRAILREHNTQREKDDEETEQRDEQQRRDHQHQEKQLAKRTSRPHYLMAVHPHGVFSISTLLGFVLPPPNTFGPLVEELPTTFVHPILLSLPLIRELFLLLGCRPARRDDMVKRLAQRSDTVDLVSVVVPGGIKELIYPDMYTQLDSPRLPGEPGPTALQQNWGFLKLAYETGAIVVPCYCRAETSLFRTWLTGWNRLRVWTYKLVGYPFPTVVWGPRRPLAPEGMRLVIGRPITPLPYNPKTQTADLAHLKAVYFDNLCSIRHSDAKSE